MDRRERYEDPEEMLRAALDGRQGQMWTALPGIIQSFDAAANTAVVQPATQGRVNDRTGKETFVDLPLLLDCPVQFPSGGGVSLTFPVKQGDECLVVFASRGIDFWWQSSGVQPPAETRMHDLSDGFVLLGVRSKPRALASVNAAAAELRSDDGSTFVRLNPTAKTVEATAPGGVTITADTSLSGDFMVDGDTSMTGDLDVTGDVTIGGNLTVASLAG